MITTNLSNVVRSLIGSIFLWGLLAGAQEPKIFMVSDFDLQGNVKNCLVLTDYGKEEFAFDTQGYLTKWVTRYNDLDYDITYYRYLEGQLKERRDERYRDGAFDKHTSIAHFYVLDSVKEKRLTETIISYNQELLDQYQYIYDEKDRIKLIVRTNDQGVDETAISRSSYKDENTVDYELNGVLVKSIRDKTVFTKTGDTLKLILEKEFVDGIGVKASEKTFNTIGQLLEEQQFLYNQKKNSFEPSTLITYTYAEQGEATKMTTSTDKTISEKQFIYQYDKEENGNWVKKITTPDNTYVTRKIDYYKPAKNTAEKN